MLNLPFVFKFSAPGTIAFLAFGINDFDSMLFKTIKSKKT